jgi:hypothetical protein
MLQVFDVDVAKVDRDVAMAIHVCCTSIPNVSSIFLYVCCKCVYLDVAIYFTRMLQVFYLDVADAFAMALKCFQLFLQVFQTHVLVFHLPSNVYCKYFI